MANKSDDQRKAMFANMANPRSKRKSKGLKRPKRSGSVLSSPSSTRNLPRRLPIVTVKGVKYFRDNRLKEFRAVDDPHKRISFKDISDAGDWMDSIHPKDGKRIYILSEEIKAKQREAVEKKRKIAKSSSKKSGSIDLLEKESKRIDAMIKRKQKKEPLEGVRKHKLMTVELRKKIPKLYSQENVKNPVVRARFFSPYSGYNFHVTEFDGEDILFGYVSGVSYGGDEWGYSSLKEITKAEKKGFPGLNYVERDRYFKPKKFSETNVGKALRKTESSSTKSKNSLKNWGIIKSERATVLKGSTIWKMQYAPREKFIRKNLTVDARKKWDSSTEVEKVIAIDRLESKGFFRKRGIQNV